jgi:hypothetical protein
MCCFEDEHHWAYAVFTMTLISKVSTSRVKQSHYHTWIIFNIVCQFHIFKGDDSSWPRTSRQRSHLRPPDLPRRPRATIFDVTVVSLRRARPRQSDRQPRAPVHDVPQWVNNPLQERGQPPKRFHIFYVRGFNSFLWFCSRLENQTSDLPVRVLKACSKIFVMG